MTHIIVYIGGQSQSGKTTTAKSLSEKLGFKHIDLDKNECIRKLQKEENSTDNAEKQKELALKIMSDAAQNTVVEGSQLRPADLSGKAGTNKLLSCFCGYPNATAQSKLGFIAATGYKNADHIKKLTGEQQLTKFEQLIENSKNDQKDCAKHGIMFFDFSVVEQLNESQNLMIIMIAQKVVAISTNP